VPSPSFNWNRCPFYGKAIVVLSAAAVASMLMPWIDIGIATRNGFSSDRCLMLAFYIYPLARVLQDRRVFWPAAAACGVIPAYITFRLAMSYKTK
jgi:hypothetical protein